MYSSISECNSILLMDRVQLNKIESTMIYALQVKRVCFLLIHCEVLSMSAQLRNLHECDMNPDLLKPKCVGLLQ